MPNGEFMITFEDGAAMTLENNQFKIAEQALAGFGDRDRPNPRRQGSRGDREEVRRLEYARRL